MIGLPVGAARSASSLKRTGVPFFAGPQDHVEVAAVEPEHNLAGRRLRVSPLSAPTFHAPPSPH